MSDKDDLKARLIAAIDALAAHLVPDGRRSSHYWIGRCPWRADRHGGSFWVNLGGQVPGSFKDAATGESGDVLDLVQKTLGLDFVGAMAWSRGWLGLDGMSAAERDAKLAAARAKAAALQAKAKESEPGKIKRAKAVYLESRKRDFLGSPADKYLRWRGIAVSELPRMPGVLGWLPDHPHTETGTRWPVMVAGMTAASGEIVAIHRTFLRPDGSGKAPVEPVKKMWPSMSGAAIRLWRGGSGLSVGEAAKCGLRETLVMTEGIEDALSAVVSNAELRTWAAGSLGNLAKVELPECVDDVIVCADNDWGKPQAARQFEAALAALVAQGRTVRVARSPVGKDVNSALTGGRT